MAVDGGVHPISLEIKRDSFGIWKVTATRADKAQPIEGRSPKLVDALARVIAFAVDHPFDVRGLAGAVEKILGE